MSNKEYMRKTLWVGGIVLVAIIACLSLYCYMLRRRAESIVHSAYELSHYQKNFLTSAELKRRYGNDLKPLQECSSSFCAYEVVITNRVLAVLGVVPYTELRSEFWMRNDIVYENMLDYTTTVHGRYTIVAHSAIGYNEDAYFSVHPWDASAPLDTNGFAHISAALSDSQKQTVLALDTGCLTKIGGCTSIAELLPSVWQPTTNGQIRCIVSNHEGFVIAPADWPWVKGAEHIEQRQ
jgi:hypothetical protein